MTTSPLQQINSDICTLTLLENSFPNARNKSNSAKHRPNSHMSQKKFRLQELNLGTQVRYGIAWRQMGFC